MRKRNVEIKVRLNENEAARLKSQVKKSGLSQAAFLRQLISGQMPKALPPAEYYAMMQEVYNLEAMLRRLQENLASHGWTAEADGIGDARREVVDGIRSITATVLEPERRRESQQ